ncbi:endonuclease domain-containing protein [Amnibacterium sp.]|uniref:endonuclease domain-containing protein n=1 Tax=Amnibacterium sp. TaxID=1872496 RepID=UPI002632AB0D|nr:DUF559 domain-containing protein [Amnibacterium sp.]MCU1473061.1 hypothetical protein [Amnibacterium sp.]
MPHPFTPLPEDLGDHAFRLTDGLAAGLTPKQLLSTRFERPFAGVRSTGRPMNVAELASAYAAKMHPSAFFSHTTAAILHGMWLPLAQQDEQVLHVSVTPPSRAPRDRRVRGHHLVDRPGLVQVRGGMRVASPVETWCQLATQLGLLDLVVSGESLLAKGRPFHFPLHRLVTAVEAGDRPRQQMLERAVPALREGVRSPWETVLRLLLVGAGLPEPEINGTIRNPDGGFVAECDLVYRSARIVIEYEGAHHFADAKVARKDITRYERLQDLGWRVIRVTIDDLRLHPEEVIARVRKALETRA